MTGMPTFFGFVVVRHDGAWVTGSKLTKRRPKVVRAGFKVVPVRVDEAYTGAPRQSLEGAEQRFLDELLEATR